MHIRFSFKPCSLRKSYGIPVLLAVWFVSLIVGLHIASLFHFQYHVLYHAAASKPAGFIGLLAVFFLPFLLTVIAVHYGKLWLILPVAAVKAFILGFNVSMLQFTFGQSAWLVRQFTLFSDAFSSFLLLCLWLICLSKEQKQRGKYYIAYSIISLLLIVIDLYLISAFFSGIVIG